jgi:hypothetical protein
MTCYFRGLQEIFKKAGIQVTKENRRELNQVIQRIVGTENGNCPETWREVKQRIADDEKSFIFELSKAWKTKKRLPVT